MDLNLKDISDQKIIISALDWGLGHVCRSIALIQELKQNNQVIIAANPTQQVIFKSYFPDLHCEDFAGYDFKFNGKARWKSDLLRMGRRFYKRTKSENSDLARLALKHEVNLIISDHRYGFYHPKIRSVFVLHQLHLPLPRRFYFIQKWHERQLNKFNEIWVLDESNHRLAGHLSNPIDHPKLLYLGIKSRFQGQTSLQQQKKYKFLVVVSGPKPYAQLFLNELLQVFTREKMSVAFLYPQHLNIPNSPLASNVHLFPVTNLKENDQLFYQCETFISRPGYTTLMDLKTLKIPAVLYPTPGQSEQVYLTKHLQNDPQFTFLTSLSDFNTATGN